ncbi:MAG: hypothetical protein GU343_02730 [Nanoarchaeota archaeon]|jgi:hypothetical protein|nr:hypothetical protein [Nanoarchaeota archaeon]
MERINIRLDDVIDKYIKEIDNKLDDIKSEDIIYVGIVILEEICKKSANVECKYDLSGKPPVLYNLRENELKELVGRTFLGVIPDFYYSSRIPYDHLRYLENKVKSIIEEFSHYKKLEKSKTKIERLIYHKLGKIYQTVGSEILRKLEEMNMIKIIKIEKHENSPVYVTILDKAYEFMANYEEYRTTDSEYEYKIMEEYD